MKRLYAIIFLVAVAVSFNCQKEISHAGEPGVEGPDSPDAMITTVQGNVIDENGAPAADVTIKAGDKTVLTDAKGYFRITGSSLDKTAAVVTADKSGYFRSFRTFQASEAANYIKIKLTKRQFAGTIPATGGDVTLSNGAKIGLPSNAVVKSAGGSYAGDVKVFAAYIDPTSTDIGAAVPGSFLADDASGRRVTLASFGMLAVELESSAAEKLQIAGDKQATLTMPIPASLQQVAPSVISLWFVDEKTGVWKEEGTAARTGNNYTGTVKHFSFWNCDVSLPLTGLSFTLKNEKGLPLVHAAVRLRGSVNGIMSESYGFTDSTGKISGSVLQGQVLTMEVLSDECNTPVYTAQIGPFLSYTDLGIITVTSATNAIVTIRGKLVNCEGAAVLNGSALISIQNKSVYVSTDQNGEFSMVYVKCDNSQPMVTVLGIDNATVQQGNSGTFTLPASSELNTGTMSACGTSASQFISFKVDGTDHLISNLTAPDSLLVYSYPVQQPVSFMTTVSGYQSAEGKGLNISFRSNALVMGTYPVHALYVNQFGSVEPDPSSTITVTSFPLTPGQFIEGTFTGLFRDSIGQDPLHTISGSFRVRKQ